MLTSTARYETANGSEYSSGFVCISATRLSCASSPDQGGVTLQRGPAEITADEVDLTERLTAEDMKGLISARYVIDIHLVIFVHREGFFSLH